MSLTRVLRRVAPPVLAGVFLTLTPLERRRPLRQRHRESKTVRVARNLTIAAAGALTVTLLERPIAQPLARLSARRGWGLVPVLPLPRALQTACGP